MEAEYIALVQAMRREVIPTRRMVSHVGEILAWIGHQCEAHHKIYDI